MSIITNKLNIYLKDPIEMQGLLQKMNEGISEKSEIYTYDNQLRCDIDILLDYDSNYPRPNHICVDSSWPQMGKTGVLIGLIKLISILNLDKVMGLKDIYYVTGDNSNGLISQSKDRLNECIEKIHPGFNLHVMKNSDMKVDLVNTCILKNVLVFIDESHHGSSSERNILIQWLKSKGLDMHNNQSLVVKNAYIISNSATLFKEEISDVANVKSYATLEPGKGYVGFKEFYEHGCVEGVRVQLGVSNVEDFCIEFIERINDIKRRTGKMKCVLLRVSNTKKYGQIEEVLSSYFHVEPFFTERTTIDYYKMWTLADHQYDLWDKPLMIVIIGACRMGNTIPLYAKRNIGIYYDFAGNQKDGVIATIQGLFGRASGYWTGEAADDWKDVTIFINNRHLEALRENKIENRSKTPLFERIENTFVPNENGSELKLIPDPTYVEIKTDKKFDGKTYNEDIGNFLRDESKKGRMGSEIPDDAIWIGGRRNSKNIQTRFDTPQFNSNSVYMADIYKPENENKMCFTAVYDMDEGTIKVRFGTIVRGDYKKEFIETTQVTRTLLTSN